MPVIPAVERLGRNADFVEQEQQTILNGSDPGAFPIVVAPGRTDRWIEDGNFAGAPQTRRKLHVFH